MSVIEEMKARGFIEQMTHEQEIIKLLNSERVTYYIGFDPTADSLTVGHYLTIMAMAHLQRAGHKPIALMGGGTGMVGDPTDRTDMRRVLTPDEINGNIENFKVQMSRFLNFGENEAIMENNGDWLLNLQYVPFIREYGVHFSVNKMLTADSYRSRFERGLTFFEFNYMLMQAYDFLELYRKHGCKMQMGGNDQWSNIIAGIELIRKVERQEAYGMTFTILTTASGQKMGKSQKGAVWLDANKTSPYDFYQYFRNTDDADVIKFLKLLTFLPLNEIEKLAKLTGSGINEAKEVLAYELTKAVHGESAAEEAQKAAKALFGGGLDEGSIPTTNLDNSAFSSGMGILDLMEKCQLTASKSEARRLITQGGVMLNGQKVTDVAQTVGHNDFDESGNLMIQKGKKVFHRVHII